MSEPAKPKPPIPPRPVAVAPSKPALPAVLRDRLRGLYLERIRPYLRGEADPILRDADSSQRQFAEWKTVLPSELHAVLARLEGACHTRRQMDRQRRLHTLMHNWLLIHIPLSMALFTLLALHIVTALRVIPF